MTPSKIVGQGFTYDDVLLVPAYSSKLPREVSISSKFSKNIPLNIPIDIEGLSNGVAVNIGNPHIVLFGKNIKNIKLEKIGPLIEKNKLFPNRTNVEIVEVINKKKIEMRVWERGVGITLACGSGACAAVYAGQLKNLLENNVEVVLERGSLHIKIENDEALMTGPAEISFHGKIII